MTMIGVKLSDRKGDESDFVEFNIESVNYITVYKPRSSREQIPIYHTSDGSYVPLLTLRDISIALKPRGFHYVDNSTIINSKRVKHVERKGGQLKVIFNDLSEIVVSGRSRKR